jgi:hypothetical protein
MPGGSAKGRHGTDFRDVGPVASRGPGGYSPSGTPSQYDFDGNPLAAAHDRCALASLLPGGSACRRS